MVSRFISWLMATFLRWFPHPVKTGLRKVGSPDENSPVLVTGNYSLTVRRLLRSVRKKSLWLLVVHSNGINVWCASCGKELTEESIISSVKTSELSGKVKHRKLILPPFSAPGVDREKVLERTGFQSSFGPVRAKDIPAYLTSGMKKTEAMKRVRLGFLHRLDMMVSMNFVIWAPVAILFAIFWPGRLVNMTLLFWGIVSLFYAFYFDIPGKDGWQKSVTVMICLSLGFLFGGYALADNFLLFWPWIVGGCLLTFAVAFDAAGIAAPVPSDALAFMQKLGFKSFGNLMSEQAVGSIHLDKSKCSGCRTCNDICPIGVYEFDNDGKKAVVARADDCFSCGACVKQCPEHALVLH